MPQCPVKMGFSSAEFLSGLVARAELSAASLTSSVAAAEVAFCSFGGALSGENSDSI